MYKLVRNIFLNDGLIVVVIFVNSVVLILQESGISCSSVNAIDVACTVFFLVEMVVKHFAFGIKGYWSCGWNRMDGTLVILSLPSIIALCVPAYMIDLSVLLILRLLRVLRLFRMFHFFPDFPHIIKNFFLAMRRSYSVFICLFIMIVIFACLGCSLFKDAAPGFFATPLDSIYTMFRIFTGEGWNEIPDTVAASMGGIGAHCVKLYFCLILMLGCVIGMSLLNSIFVDAMVSDNNDDVKQMLSDLQNDISEIKHRMNDACK